MKKQIKQECLKNTEEESCGFVIFNKKTLLHNCRNRAANKTISFEISTSDYIDSLKMGEIFGVYHSHVEVDEEFSKKDIDSSEELMLPYFVYSVKTNTHNLYIPKSLCIKTKSFKSFLYRVRKEYGVI